MTEYSVDIPNYCMVLQDAIPDREEYVAFSPSSNPWGLTSEAQATGQKVPAAPGEKPTSFPRGVP